VTYGSFQGRPLHSLRIDRPALGLNECNFAIFQQLQQSDKTRNMTQMRIK
jgi:hypothetical protein